MVSFLIEYLNSTETLIFIDPLTGISNRRDFLNHLTDEIKSLNPATNCILHSLILTGL